MLVFRLRETHKTYCKSLFGVIGRNMINVDKWINTVDLMIITLGSVQRE